MKTIQTQWVKLRHWQRARIYKTKGGKLALQLEQYYGSLQPWPGQIGQRSDPRYYSSVQGCFDALFRLGLHKGVTFDDIKEVLES